MSDQDETTFRYDKMVEKALRSVVQQALQEVIDEGLCEEHHFYITFQTDFPGVDIPDYLKERYPNEMTIVLQHQFYDLEVNSSRFLVMLSFNNVPERLVIPLAAITIFADPSVNFALQFQPLDDDDSEDSFEDFDTLDFSEDDVEENAKPEKMGEVISLDSFRKKPTENDKKLKKANDTKKKPKKKEVTKEKTAKKKPKKADKNKDKNKD